MAESMYEKGLVNRKAVLGAEYVDKSIQSADDFNRPLQELVTTYCWGEIWGREELPRRMHSMLNIAMLTALNRPHELKLHVQGALTTCVSRTEIREVLMRRRSVAVFPPPSMHSGVRARSSKKSTRSNGSCAPPCRGSEARVAAEAGKAS
jgi:4-carboxymuconolactone decarboxylase